MRVSFSNYWKGSDMRAGGAFPLILIEVYGDINPSFRFFTFVLFNFGITIQLKTEEVDIDVVFGDKEIRGGR